MVQSHTLSGRNSGVECLLPKQDVVGSNPIARSKSPSWEGNIPSPTSNWVSSPTTSLLTTPMQRWNKSFRHGRFPLTRYAGLISSSLAMQELPNPPAQIGV